MLISYTIPCHKREQDLTRALPCVVAAAHASPPIEVVIVDYANDKTLEVRVGSAANVIVRVVTYRGRDHYHSAHARNLSIRAATGDYIVISSADITPSPGFFALLRQRLAETGATWLRPSSPAADLDPSLLPRVEYVGVIVCRRDELIAAGGFDERIEFYGSEDKDLMLRLLRRGTPWATYDATTVLSMFRTRNEDKVKHYRLTMNKTEMLRHGSAILKANVAAGVLVANDGQAWGTC